MRRRLGLAAALVAFVTVGCGPKTGTQCGGSTCNENEICDQALKLCIANTGPKIVIDAPVENALIGSATFELRGTITDDQGGLKGAEFAVGDGAWTALSADDRGVFSVMVTTPSLDGVATPIKVRATDASDASAEVAANVRVDTVAPRCAITSPVAGKPLITKNTLNGAMEASVEDGTAVTAEGSTDDGATWKPMVVAGSRATLEVALPAGVEGTPLKLRVRAEDAAGNSCTAGPLDSYVDTIAPSFVWQSPSTNFICSLANPCTITGILDGGRDFVGLFYSLDGGVEAPVVQTSSSGPFQGTIDLPAVDHTPVTMDLVARDSANNEWRESRALAIDRIAPRVTVLSPPGGTLFNAAAIADAGATVTVTWSVTDDTPILFDYLGTGRNDAGTPAQVSTRSYTFTTSAQDDGDSYVSRLEVADLGDNLTRLEHSFRVDRVHPTFTVMPTSGRLTENAVRLAFSEPTTVLNQAVALTWTTTGHANGDLTALPDGGLAWLNLTPGTLYKGALAPQGYDRANNPIQQAPVSLSFFTAPFAPDSGTILATDAGVLTAAFDQDGVVYFADARFDPATSSVRFRWFELNPNTGAPVELRSTNSTGAVPGTFKAELQAWAEIASDGTALRKRAIVETVGATKQSEVRAGSAVYAGNATIDAFILPAAIPDQVPSDTYPSDLGTILNNSGQYYRRTPNADLPHPFAGTISLAGQLSYLIWQTATVPMGSPPMPADVLDRAFFACAPQDQFGLTTCFVSGAQRIYFASNASAVLTAQGMANYVYDNGGVRKELCKSEFTLDGRPAFCPSCNTPVTAPGTGLTVFPAYEGDTIFGVAVNGGNYEVMEKSLYRCFGGWTVNLRLPVTAGDKPVPIRIGKTRAALYRDTTGNIRVLR